MPTYRPTNAGLQTRGTLWGGFDPTATAILAGVFIITIMLTFAGISVLKIHWLIALVFCFLIPNAITAFTFLLLVIGKPPRYLRDWFESRILRRSSSRLDMIPNASLDFTLE